MAVEERTGYPGLSEEVRPGCKGPLGHGLFLRYHHLTLAACGCSRLADRLCNEDLARGQLLMHAAHGSIAVGRAQGDPVLWQRCLCSRRTGPLCREPALGVCRPKGLNLYCRPPTPSLAPQALSACFSLPCPFRRVQPPDNEQERREDTAKLPAVVRSARRGPRQSAGFPPMARHGERIPRFPSRLCAAYPPRVLHTSHSAFLARVDCRPRYRS